MAMDITSSFNKFKESHYHLLISLLISMAYNVEPFCFKISLYKDLPILLTIKFIKLSKVQFNHFIINCIIKIDIEKNCYKMNIIFEILILIDYTFLAKIHFWSLYFGGVFILIFIFYNVSFSP
jgi:hypothetical protein